MNQRTLNYVLIGSITLNAFLLGVMAMHGMSNRGLMHERRRHLGTEMVGAELAGEQRGPRLLRGLVRAAGGPKDPRVQSLWSGHRQQLAPLREQSHLSRERVMDALAQERFDRELLSQALNEALAARNRVDKMANDGVLELAEKMTPAERAKVRLGLGSFRAVPKPE
jgi:uncharacterized membrane protein